jgi:hypothetical protein
VADLDHGDRLTSAGELAREGTGWLERGETGLELLPVPQPSACGLEVRRGHVDLVELDETSRAEQAEVVAAGTDRRWSAADRPAMIT